MMPRHLVLVRHGESEGNVAVKRSENGDDRDFTPEFRQRPSRLWCLTDRGREQAILTGAWLRERFPSGFGRRYVSETIRTYNTAGLLGINGPRWFNEPDLIERNWGHFDGMTEAERLVEYGHVLSRKDGDPYMWAPPGGESIHSVRTRIRWVLSTLHRECSEMDVIQVVHGEVMWCYRSLLERMTLKRFTELDGSDDPLDRINNCQVLIYTRVNPETGIEQDHTGWVYSTCPHDLSKSTNRWERLERPTFSDEELLVEAALVSRLVNE